MRALHPLKMSLTAVSSAACCAAGCGTIRMQEDFVGAVGFNWERQLDREKLREAMAHPVSLGEQLEFSDEQL